MQTPPTAHSWIHPAAHAMALVVWLAVCMGAGTGFLSAASSSPELGVWMVRVMIFAAIYAVGSVPIMRRWARGAPMGAGRMFMLWWLTTLLGSFIATPVACSAL